MTEVVQINEAKARLDELVSRVEAGEEVVIGRDGTPVARLIPEPRRTLQPPGAWRGRVTIADDFDAPLAGFADERIDEPYPSPRSA